MENGTHFFRTHKCTGSQMRTAMHAQLNQKRACLPGWETRQTLASLISLSVDKLHLGETLWRGSAEVKKQRATTALKEIRGESRRPIRAPHLLKEMIVGGRKTASWRENRKFGWDRYKLIQAWPLKRQAISSAASPLNPHISCYQAHPSWKHSFASNSGTANRPPLSLGLSSPGMRPDVVLIRKKKKSPKLLLK